MDYFDENVADQNQEVECRWFAVSPFHPVFRVVPHAVARVARAPVRVALDDPAAARRVAASVPAPFHRGEYPR